MSNTAEQNKTQVHNPEEKKSMPFGISVVLMMLIVSGLCGAMCWISTI